MVNFERVLAGMIRNRVRRRSPRLLRRLTSQSFGLGGKTVAGLGVLGLAFAAFEHFGDKGKAQQPAVSGDGPRPRTAGPPPPPGAGRRAVPPPPPGTVSQPEVPPLLPGQESALLLIRAMIAAANADGQIDEQERIRILGRLEEEGFGPQERDFILKELKTPQSVDSLLPRADTPELKRQIYVVSLLAVDVDTKAEEDYLEYLAARLEIDESTRHEIHRQLN